MKLAALAVLALAGAGQASAQSVHSIDMKRLDDASQFAFLRPFVDSAEVVSLGESLHLTSDFPLVRIGIVRYLNQQHGYRVIALEGSPADIWVGQDRLIASARAASDVTASMGGWFPIWNTTDMRQLAAYEVQSWSTSRPLYVTAYDVQPGTGRTTGGIGAFQQLTERLATYAPAPAGIDQSQVVAGLAPLTRACGRYSLSDSANVERAIGHLGTWIDAAAPAVAARAANLPHAVVLRLIPENLRASHRLCMSRVGQGWNVYKSVRDSNAARYALKLKSAMPNQKLILWAHLSHVSYNSANNGIAVGQMLRRELGPRIYTIVPFAESGIAPLIYSDVNDDIAYGRVHGTATPLGARLSGLSNDSYFLDVRGLASDSMFATRQSLAVESETWPVTPAKDFDAILWVKRVHSAHFLGGGWTWMMIGLTATHYWPALVSLLAIAIVLATLTFVVRRRARLALAD